MTQQVRPAETSGTVKQLASQITSSSASQQKALATALASPAIICFQFAAPQNKMVRLNKMICSASSQR